MLDVQDNKVDLEEVKLERKLKDSKKQNYHCNLRRLCNLKNTLKINMDVMKFTEV